MSTPHIDLASVLERAPLLSSLSRIGTATTRCPHRMQIFRYRPMLFSEGDPCNGLHIIARGKVRIFKTSINGREQVLALNGPGETRCRLPVFDGGPYPASAMAVVDSEIAFISRRDFQAFCIEHPKLRSKSSALSAAACVDWWGLSKNSRSPLFASDLSRYLSSLPRLQGNHRTGNSISATRNASGTCQSTRHRARTHLAESHAASGRRSH